MKDRFPTRNVYLREFEGNPVSGFWQYGFVDWKTFYTWLNGIVAARESWAIFDWTETDRTHGQIKAADNSLVDPGTYILLRLDGAPLEIGLPLRCASTRRPSISDTATSTHYQTRVRACDPACLITGTPVAGDDYSDFKAAHIFSRDFEADSIKAGYPSRITDHAPLDHVGGPSKIDSVQNVILPRADIRDAWDNYKFSVNPDAGYIITPFINGYADIAGKTLMLDHISDPNLRPLDDLFRDHLLRGVLKYMNGTGEPPWNIEDAVDVGIDLSRADIWATEGGKERLEFVLLDRLHDFQVQQREEDWTT